MSHTIVPPAGFGVCMLTVHMQVKYLLSSSALVSSWRHSYWQSPRALLLLSTRKSGIEIQRVGIREAYENRCQHVWSRGERRNDTKEANEAEAEEGEEATEKKKKF